MCIFIITSDNDSGVPDSLPVSADNKISLEYLKKCYPLARNLIYISEGGTKHFLLMDEGQTALILPESIDTYHLLEDEKRK